jgi:uncharacterized membrane protein
VSERRLVHWLPLAHHRPEAADRCVHLPFGPLRVALCARCLGLYPTLGVALAAQAALRLGRAGNADWWLCLVGLAPALFDWGLSMLGRARGSNAMRLLTGVVLGVSLARGFWLYFRDQRCEIFWVQMGLLAAGAAAFAFVRWLRL